MATQFVWNKDFHRKIKLTSIKEFVIRGYAQDWDVIAMLPGDDHTLMFKGTSKDSCQEFVDGITRVD